MNSCAWKEDENGKWWTDCGNAFVFINGGPSENSMNYCCYCGAVLNELHYHDPESEE